VTIIVVPGMIPGQATLVFVIVSLSKKTLHLIVTV